ncbi:glycerophosphodiester phosphodiesterase [Candidatus Hodarchaeum mangrovi]
MHILAHRGYLVNGDPENSIPAFQTAIHHHADGLEFDIHLTADKQFVCYHDESLSKIGMHSLIRDLTTKEIEEVDLNNKGIKIPSLEEILELFANKTLLNIEVKFFEGAVLLIDLLNQYDVNFDISNLIISSFNIQPLKEIKRHNENVPTALLCHLPKIDLALELKCDAIHPFYDPVPPEKIKLHSRTLTQVYFDYLTSRGFKEAKNSGLHINLYPVNDENYLKKAFKQNIDGIITDNLEKAINKRTEFMKR